MNYPVHDFEPPKDAYTSDGKLVSTEQHKDSGIITLLTTFGNEGLQVRLLTGGCMLVIKFLVSPGILNFFLGGGGGGGDGGRKNFEPHGEGAGGFSLMVFLQRELIS